MSIDSIPRYFVAVDFDGTVVQDAFPEVGKTVEGAVSTLKWLIEQKADIIINTMRSGKYLEQVIDWYKQNDIKYYSILRNPTQHSWTTSPKVYANVYIDDLALGAPLYIPEGSIKPCIDWSKAKELIENSQSFKDFKRQISLQLSVSGTW